MSFIVSLGILGAVVAYVLREISDRTERRRKLRGQLRLIDSEMRENRRELKTFAASPRWITDAPERALKANVWKECRVELSGLLDDENLFRDINKLYVNVQEINWYRLNGEADPSSRRESIVKLLPLMTELYDVVEKGLLEHLPDATATEGTPLSALKNREKTPQDIIEDLIEQGKVEVIEQQTDEADPPRD